MFWNKYPYTDYSQINLDWLIRHIGGILKELADSAGFLPKIKASDEGKFLSVDNGKPVWNSVAGGSAFVVSVKNLNAQYLVLDKTWSEIKNAADNNIPIIINDSERAGEGNYKGYGILSLINEISDEGPFNVVIFLNSEGSYAEWDFSTDNINGYPDTTGNG